MLLSLLRIILFLDLVDGFYFLFVEQRVMYSLILLQIGIGFLVAGRSFCQTSEIFIDLGFMLLPVLRAGNVQRLQGVLSGFIKLFQTFKGSPEATQGMQLPIGMIKLCKKL